jgi:hypothetical protein
LTATRRRRPAQPVLAGAAQDPFAERDHQAALLGDGDEPDRADQPLRGVRPAHEGFERHDGLAVRREDRLIMQAEFVPIDRAAQVVLDRLAHADGLVHLPREEAESVSALAFRLVEGCIGEAHQILAVDAVVRCDRNTDGDADADRRAADLERLGDGIEDSASERIRVLRGAQPGLDDREFVAAEAGEGVARPQQLLEPARHELDELVAGRVAVGVVDILEAVEVEEHHRETRAGPAHPVEFLVEPLPE